MFKGHYVVDKMTSCKKLFAIVLLSLVTRIYFIYLSLLGAYHCLTSYLYVTSLNEALKCR